MLRYSFCILVCLLLVGCSDIVEYKHTSYEQGQIVEQTFVKYNRNAGNSNKENLNVVLGSKENPLASLAIGKSEVDMDNFYDTWKETMNLMTEALEKYLEIRTWHVPLQPQ